LTFGLWPSVFGLWSLEDCALKNEIDTEAQRPKAKDQRPKNKEQRTKNKEQ
jgi:hypothetical protein